MDSMLCQALVGGVRGLGADSQYLTGSGQMAYERRDLWTLPTVSGKARFGPRHVAIRSSQFLSLYVSLEVVRGQCVRAIATRPSASVARRRESGRLLRFPCRFRGPSVDHATGKEPRC